MLLYLRDLSVSVLKEKIRLSEILVMFTFKSIKASFGNAA